MKIIRTQDEQQAADQHEEILAGLANELPHSRIRIDGVTGCRAVQWTYSGNGRMVAL